MSFGNALGWIYQMTYYGFQRLHDQYKLLYLLIKTTFVLAKYLSHALQDYLESILESFLKFGAVLNGLLYLRAVYRGEYHECEIHVGLLILQSLAHLPDNI